MSSDSFEGEKQRETKKKNGANARFVLKLSFFPSEIELFPSTARLISHLECDENEKKKVSLNG